MLQWTWNILTYSYLSKPLYLSIAGSIASISIIGLIGLLFYSHKNMTKIYFDIPSIFVLLMALSIGWPIIQAAIIVITIVSIIYIIYVLIDIYIVQCLVNAKINKNEKQFIKKYMNNE